jgi:hypothetical protein
MSLCFGDWLGGELERSPQFAQELARLRGEAQRPRRATKCLDEFGSVAEMHAELRAAWDSPREDRLYAWRELTHARTDAPSEPLAHVERYSRRLQTRAYYFTGASANADALHALVCGSAAGIPIPGAIASLPAPLGAGASSIAAGFNDDMRWSSDTSRQAFRRHVADVGTTRPTFYYRRNLAADERSRDRDAKREVQ